MIAVVDNYDSFTYNLVQYLGLLHGSVRVFRNDEIQAEDLLSMQPDYLVLSPGPGRPQKAGNLLDIVKKCGPKIPTLGVCLGHQAIGVAYGAKLAHAPVLMHGKSSPTYHNRKGIFEGLANPFEAGRYHSLVVDGSELPASLEATAHSADGDVMALRHCEFPIMGVQFHPESVLTREGFQVLRNFLRIFGPHGGR